MFFSSDGHAWSPSGGRWPPPCTSAAIARRHGLPVTSVARTLVDQAATSDDLELESELAEALERNLVSRTQVEAAIDRAPYKAGVRSLRRLLQTDRPARTRSYYERKLLRLIRAAELPEPIANARAEGHMVDLLWPEQRLVVELDSARFHSDREAFETDRLRDQRLVAAGYRVIRITARQIDHASYAVIARIAAALV